MLDKFFNPEQPNLPNQHEKEEEARRKEEAKLHRELERQVRATQFYEKVEGFINKHYESEKMPEYVTELITITPSGTEINLQGYNYLTLLVADSNEGRLVDIMYQGQFIKGTRLEKGYNNLPWRTGTVVSSADGVTSFSVVVIKQMQYPL